MSDTVLAAVSTRGEDATMIVDSTTTRGANLADSRFDLSLFQALNDEYADRPLVPKPRKFTPSALMDQANRRAKAIGGRVELTGRRVLEVGCGRGHLGDVLADAHGCTYTGVDIVDYPEWADPSAAGVAFERLDISTEPSDDLGEFDVVVSMAVLEHVVHPYSMLKAMYERLRPGGVAYLAANLYRGPKASHRYREVFFPWPHLLFGDNVWREFYRTVHGRENTLAWVNKLTYAEYLTYFDLIGFQSRKVWLTDAIFDAEFYARFEDVLSAYPVFDLSHDFVYAVLERPVQPLTPTGENLQQLHRENARLCAEVAALRASTSWRVTAPLRRLSKALGR
jgi:2-polyprenyl-3-methyl-5-hydroxy-6-metoxy-1,4-benzoquinol methylase